MKKNEIIRFKDHNIYVFRKKKQRFIRLTIEANGFIRLSSTKRVSQKDLLQFILKNEFWLEKQLNQQKELQKKNPKKLFFQGESFIFLGQHYILSFYPHPFSIIPEFHLESPELKCYVPSKEWNSSYYITPQSQIKPFFLSFIMNQSHYYLVHLTQKWAQIMNLHPQKISIRKRSQKTLWGSCNSHGHISLNWKLVLSPSFVSEYVVIHELSHLIYPNHSVEFWNLVRKYCSSHKASQMWLRKNSLQLNCLDD